MSKKDQIKVEFDGLWCTFRPLTYKNVQGSTDHCGLCEGILLEGQEIFLAMNNYTMFPNRFIHKKCVDSEFENIAKRLRVKWKQAQAYAGWFGG